jgi:multidrug efflux pump subunit AcrA (membrane-fusion protein)
MRNQGRRLAMLAAVVLAMLGAGCRGSGNSSAQAGSADPAASRATVVSAVAATSRQVSAAVQVTGSFVSKESSDVAPEAAGRIVETPVNVGDFVKQGEVIARLEDRDAQLRLEQALASDQQAEAAVRQAQSRIGLGQGQAFNADNVPEVLSAKAAYDSALAQATLAEADAQRYENLIKTGDVSRSAYEKARTQADTARAQANSAHQQYEAAVNSARQNFQGVMTAQASLSGMHVQTAMARKAVEDTLIRSPFPGYVSSRPVASGQYVALTSKIATVLRITPIKLELQVPESDAPKIRAAAPVEANVPGYPGRDFQGKVTAINPAVDSNSRTFTVEAEFPNGDLALKPGMFATARVLLPGSTDGIFLPRRVVITDPSTNSSQVFFIREGKARLAVVQLGPPDGDLIQILSGLSPGAIVATDHLQDLYDGEAVSIEGRLKPAQASAAKTAGKG